MLSGFVLAAYSIIANDVIQTLGTFLSSNHSTPWWVLWIFAACILAGVLLFGWYWNSGDAAYGLLTSIPLPEVFHWWHVAPPLLLLLLTRFGFPVSTTFLILSIFSSNEVMTSIVMKSLLGYGVAFGSALLAYGLLTSRLEQRFLQEPNNRPRLWIALQWLSTGFLWSQWLIQDLANIFVYVPRQQKSYEIAGAVLLLVSLLAILFWQRGGRVQHIVLSKTNTTDIRSATIIDFIYGLILLFFKELSNLPMSTTWVFVGLLAGREIGLVWRLGVRPARELAPLVFKDLAKVTTGLVASVLLVYLIRILR
jgi:phosphate/sulfate permease